MALGAYVPRIDGPGKRAPLSSQRALHPVTRNVALLGFGNVGRAVADILCRTPQPHLRLTHVFNRNFERKRVAWVADRVQWTDNFQEVLTSDADVVVELIGRLEPAHEFIKQALRSGKSVVTANKHVMAKHGPELVELARQHGQRLEYGASVGGGVPVLAALRYGLAGDRLVRVCGILNGTCNFILSNMEANGTALGAALAEAQKLGYAESDPCDDVNGVDAACKLAIVARLGLQTYLNAFEIPRQSINQIQPADFAFARQLGYTIRQISFAELKANAVQTSVGPALVPLNSPLASTAANQNAIIVTGERSGETLLVGKGAGGDPTAVAVVSDLLALTEPGHSQTGAPVAKNHAAEELKRPHYLRVCRQQGTDLLSAVTRILDAHGVRVQKALDNTDKQTWQAAALLLETCSGAVVHKTVEEIAKLDGVSQAPLCLPIFD